MFPTHSRRIYEGVPECFRLNMESPPHISDPRWSHNSDIRTHNSGTPYHLHNQHQVFSRI